MRSKNISIDSLANILRLSAVGFVAIESISAHSATLFRFGSRDIPAEMTIHIQNF